jgi:hypothetical protein
MRKKVALALTASLLTGGCTQYTIGVGEPRYAGQQHARPVVSLAGGTASKPNPGAVAEECGAEQLAMVRVTRDFGQAFLSVLTLGLYAPATIHFYCATATPPPIGEIQTPGA